MLHVDQIKNAFWKPPRSLRKSDPRLLSGHCFSEILCPGGSLGGIALDPRGNQKLFGDKGLSKTALSGFDKKVSGSPH